MAYYKVTNTTVETGCMGEIVLYSGKPRTYYAARHEAKLCKRLSKTAPSVEWREFWANRSEGCRILAEHALGKL